MVLRTLPWTVEAAYVEFKELGLVNPAIDQTSNEAEIRFKIIDDLFFNVLDWEKGDAELEKYCREVGFADYVLSTGGQVALVVEAKRASAEFVIPDVLFRPEPLAFALLEKECKEAGSALRQALGYAASLGARYIAISNGTQWIIALTYVQAQRIEDRQVVVFDSLRTIGDNFRRFWQCFSKQAVSNNEIFPLLMESRKKPAPSKLSMSIPGYPIPSERNKFMNELSYILNTVWDVLSRTENTLLFLETCYVPPVANAHLIAFADDVLRRRYAADQSIHSSVAPAEPMRLKEAIVGYDNEKPFVVLGNVGHGKTTFLAYLRLVAAKDILENYIQLEVNFLDRPDSADEVNDFIYGQLEAQLLDRHGIDIFEDSIVRGSLHSLLQRFHASSRYKAYEASPEIAKAEELSFIQEQLKDRHSYYQAVVRHLKRGRGKSIAVFFDNLDRRGPQIQENAFLKASAIARDWECVVFICLRPSTFYDSLRSGLLDSLAPKTFTLGSADLSLVLKRRFKFAERLALGEIETPILQVATKDRSLSLRLPSVAEIFACCEFSTRKDASAIQMLAALSNGNIRNLLDLTKRVLTSGHLDTGKILHQIQLTGTYFVPSFEAVKTLLYGDYDQFDSRYSTFVNLFDIYHSDAKEHFVRALILEYLSRFHDEEQIRSWVLYNQLATYLESFYFDVVTIQRHLSVLVEGGCVEAGRASSNDGENGVSGFRLTTKGSYHINNIVVEFQYIDAVCVDTPIIDTETQKFVVETRTLSGRLSRTRSFLAYLQKCSADLTDSEGKKICTQIINAGLNECTVVQERSGVVA